MTQTAAEIFRDYDLAGVPASGPNKPEKAQLRAWGTLMEDLRAGVGIAYPTLALLNADLAHDAGTLAMVYADSSPANGGLYRKNGATGGGSWTRIGDSPNDVIRLTVTGGTANAIQVTTPETPSVPGDKLYLLTPTLANTGAVTIATNAGTPAAVKNAVGSSLAPNAFLPALPVLMAWQVDHFQTLVSLPVDASGVLNDTLAARDAAAGSAASAASSASALGNQVHQYDTRAQAQAATIPYGPTGVQAIKITRYAAGSPLAVAMYVQGTSSGPMAFQDAAGNYWQLDLSGKIAESAWFNIKGDGVTDDRAQLQVAATACSGKTLRISGLCGVSARVVLPDNITLVGSNNKLDGFKVLGSNALASGILYINNKSGIVVRNLRFTGNFVEPPPFSSGAMQFELDVSATTDMLGFEVSGCYFADFRTTQWIWFVSDRQTANPMMMRGISVINNEVYALPQCATTNAISGQNGNTFVRVTGNNAIGVPPVPGGGAFTGAVSNIVFANNTCRGEGLSGMFQAFANTREMVVTGNATRNMGNNTIPTDFSYTYLFYNSDPTTVDPTNIVCSNNVGYGNHNNAVYLAGARNAAVTGNSFGFTYPSGIEPTLPHGSAIAINGVGDCTVSGNVLTDALVGVAYVGISFRPATVTISDNAIRSSTNSTAGQAACGILLTGDPTGAPCITNVVGNAVTLTGTAACGISLAAGAGYKHGRLNIADNVISSTQLGISCTATLLAPTVLRLSGNQYSGGLALFGMNLDTGTALAILEDEVVDGITQTAGGAVGARLTGTNYVINGLTVVNNGGSSTGFSAAGAQGSLRNVRFPNPVGPQVAAGSLGLAKPTWTVGVGAVVENLAKSELGTAGAKFIVNGWVNTAVGTWQDQRIPTGN